VKHLTPADYTRQPWKNGKGITTELWRLTQNGQLLVRLSRATVAEDGPFSLFPGLNRNLTVLTGKGFRLTGEAVNLRCDPLHPVSFPGDAPVTAKDTHNQASDDFNVMTAAHLAQPEVTVLSEAHVPANGLLALYALGPATVNGTHLATQDLILTEGSADIAGKILVTRLHLT
jgi:hypothetical protein